MGYAQKGGTPVAYIDMDYILKNLPAYATANEQLDMYSTRWQKEIEQLQQESEVMTIDYHTEQLFLTEPMKRQREKAIADKEKEVLTLKQKYFGADGELFEKRASLLKPIQDEIYVAIEAIATEDRINVVKDRSCDASLVYMAGKLDISDKVLARMGGQSMVGDIKSTFKKIVNEQRDEDVKVKDSFKKENLKKRVVEGMEKTNKTLRDTEENLENTLK